mgnify:CR=1 FL=1
MKQKDEQNNCIKINLTYARCIITYYKSIGAIFTQRIIPIPKASTAFRTILHSRALTYPNKMRDENKTTSTMHRNTSIDGGANAINCNTDTIYPSHQPSGHTMGLGMVDQAFGSGDRC